MARPTPIQTIGDGRAPNNTPATTGIEAPTTAAIGDAIEATVWARA